MGRISRLFKRDSLKKSFITAVSVMVILVVTLSVLSILGCFAVQNWLVPVRDEVMLHIYRETPYGVQESSMRMRTNGEHSNPPVLIAQEDDEPIYKDAVTGYAIVPIASPEFLSPKRMLLYNAMSVCTVALPMLYAVLGIILCGIRFYNKKLARPLSILFEGAEKIAGNDLDFTMHSDQNNEMGMLCNAFEKMRSALLESQRTTWALMEERKQLNASVAHDIRTPITIIEGYTEYLQRNLKNGKADEETLMRTLAHLSESAARLERYVDSVRDIQNLDDMPINKTEANLKDAVCEIAEDMAVLANQADKRLNIDMENIPDINTLLDKQVLSRILENLISNATRYAKEQIDLRFSTEEDLLMVMVRDDGPGFTKKTLDSGTTPFYKESDTQEHMGLGLAISKTLCRKHGGNIHLQNATEGGAVVRFRVTIK